MHRMGTNVRNRARQPLHFMTKGLFVRVIATPLNPLLFRVEVSIFHINRTIKTQWTVEYEKDYIVKL